MGTVREAPPPDQPVGGGNMPAQSIPPIVHITAGVAGMGALQYGVHWISKPSKATDGPVHFRAYQGMDKWDYYMQNRDANLIRDSLGGKAAKAGWWDSVKKPAL